MSSRLGGLPRRSVIKKQLFGSGRWSCVGPAESDPALVVEVDLQASFVDNDLMMEPAQDDEFVLVGLPSLGPGGEMVDLQSAS